MNCNSFGKSLCFFTQTTFVRSGHIFGCALFARRRPGLPQRTGAAALQEAMERLFEGRKILLVTGILADKEVDRILKHFIRISKDIIVTEPESPRKLSAQDMKEKLKAHGILPIDVTQDAEAGLEAARAIWNTYEVVLFAGSLYLIGAVRRMIRDGETDG